MTRSPSRFCFSWFRESPEGGRRLRACIALRHTGSPKNSSRGRLDRHHIRSDRESRNIPNESVLARCCGIGRNLSQGIFSFLYFILYLTFESVCFFQAMRRVHLSDTFMRDLWTRLYVYALLRGLYVFPDVEVSAESPEYESFGFVDVWKGNSHGNPVCIKAIRTRNSANLQKIKMVHDSFIPVPSTNSPPHQTFCHEVGGCKHFSHPNVLPVVQVSEALFPFCIMSPWMPGGNVMQYIQKNPSVNRLMLVCTLLIWISQKKHPF